MDRFYNPFASPSESEPEKNSINATQRPANNSTISTPPTQSHHNAHWRGQSKSQQDPHQMRFSSSRPPHRHPHGFHHQQHYRQPFPNHPQQHQRFQRFPQGPPRGGHTGYRQQFRPRSRPPSYNSSNNNSYESGGGDSESAHRPWVTPHHLQLIAERNALYEKYQSSRSEDDLRLFKIKRFEVNQIINDAKILYIQQNPNQRAQFQNHPPMQQQQRGDLNNSSAIRPPPERKAYEERSYENRGAFHCDPCERKFPTQAALDEHLGEHITCKLDGCTYTAHAKLVMKHIDLQHSTGLYSRIQGHDTPEQIAAWREERKRNWPSSENVARKAAERSEKLERGERLRNTNNGAIGDEEEVFRVRIDRHKRSDWRDEVESEDGPLWKRRRRGIEWQSDGEDEVINPDSRGRGGNERFHSAKNRLVVLTHFYTDIQLVPPSSSCNKTKAKVSGNTRITWSSAMKIQTASSSSGSGQMGKDEDEKSVNCDGEEAAEEGQFCITDDEDDGFQVSASSTAPDLNDSNPSLVLVKSQQTVVGLVSYSSCSEDEEENEDNKDAIPPPLMTGHNHDHENQDIDDVGHNSEAADSSASNCNEDRPPPGQSHRKESSEQLSSDDEPPEEVATKSTKELIEEPHQPSQPDGKSKVHDNDDEEEGECDSVHEDNPATLEKETEEDDTGYLEDPAVQRLCGYWPSSSSSSHYVQRGRKLVKKYTLLQRLLAPDIRRERNIILQACRYIVENNFFDEPPPPPASNSSVNQNEKVSTSTPERPQHNEIESEAKAIDKVSKSGNPPTL